MPDSDRVLDALENSTRVTTEVIGQVKGMTREFQALRETLGGRMEGLETQMATTNGHLGNLVQETTTTNDLLREDAKDRKRVQKVHEERDKDERVWRRKLEERQMDWEDEDRNRQITREDEQRATIQKAGTEAWGLFKQPLAYLVTGLAAWIVYIWFFIPPTL